MKNISFKKVIIAIVLLLIVFVIIDVTLNWDEAVAAFNKGYSDMNEINESRSKEHLK